MRDRRCGRPAGDSPSDRSRPAAGAARAPLPPGLKAGQAMRQAGGRLPIRLLRADVVASRAPPAPGLAPGRYMALSILDTGQGMEADPVSPPFQPLLSTNPPRE